MEPFEANCPLPSAHQRCAEAKYFLEQCLLHYHEPQPFLHNLNGFIQALRNITFMLQSELSNRENFSAWYEAKRAEMRSTPPTIDPTPPRASHTSYAKAKRYPNAIRLPRRRSTEDDSLTPERRCLGLYAQYGMAKFLLPPRQTTGNSETR